jgi:hypothetical protein
MDNNSFHRPIVHNPPPISDDAGGFAPLLNLAVLAAILLFVAVGMDRVSAAAEASLPGSGWYVGLAQISLVGGLFAWWIVRKIVRFFR